METVLGLLGIVAFILGMLVVSGAVTWTIVKISPDPNRKRKAEEPSA